MLNQNTDLYLLRHALNQLCHVVDRLIEHNSRINDMEKKNTIRDSRINDLENKYAEMIQMFHSQQIQIQSQQIQLEECQQSADYAVRGLSHLTHLAAEKEDIENQLMFYCPPD